MEHEEWENQLREEIDDLRRTHGFEEDEAAAFWHLAQARRLMIAQVIADNNTLSEIRENKYEAQGLSNSELTARQIADAAQFGGQVETRISQHFEALYKVLGNRVLRRNYPEGWGWELAETQEES